MAILIKNVQMPGQCEKCPCYDEDITWCLAKGESLSDRVFVNPKPPRPDWCPAEDGDPYIYLEACYRAAQRTLAKNICVDVDHIDAAAPLKREREK